MNIGLNPYRIPIINPLNGFYLRWFYNGWHYWHFLPGKETLSTSGEKYRTLGNKKITLSSGQITLSQCGAIRTILNTREVYIYTDAGWKNVRIESTQTSVKNNFVNGYEIELTATIGSRKLSLNGYSPVKVIPVITPPDTELCELVIGTQIWMCKNYDSEYPGSKVYENDEANRAVYGGLYTYDQIMSSGFCPVGWHIPTLSEWQILIDFLGGDTIAGGKLKEVGTTHWDSPNTGATDEVDFKALGAGYGNSGLHLSRYQLYYFYKSLLGIFWTATPFTFGNNSWHVVLKNDNAQIELNASNRTNFYYSVRLVKDISALPFNDWFLPSKDELNAIYVELYLFGVGNFVASGAYWSSSEANLGQSWHLQFGGGFWVGPNKSSLYAVRACRAFTSTTVYGLRDVGPAGGWIFWKSGNDYLEAAPTDQSIAQAWSNITNVAIGITGTAIGTGQANTTAIIGQAGHTDSAAKLCDDLVIYA